MNHPTDDQLLLLVYGELSEADARAVEAHVSGCESCRRAVAQLEWGREALELAIPRRGPGTMKWLALGVAAAAAVVAAVWFAGSAPIRPPDRTWSPTTTWSATAGYVTGGQAMVELDAHLTRLEQERYYGLPN